MSVIGDRDIIKKKAEETKVWQGWFRPTAKKPLKTHCFYISEIEKNSSSPRSEIFESNKNKRLVISVPAQVGKAYQRNKLRRQIRNFLINNKNDQHNVPQVLNRGQKGLWIRISPHFRVQKKMEFESWKNILVEKIKALSK